MTTITPALKPVSRSRNVAQGALAKAITRSGSAQTYYTVRFLADRDRAADAYRAYAYFRWVDDVVDDASVPSAERAACVRRQQALIEAGYQGYMPDDLCPEEQLLAELLVGDEEPDSGLQSYLHNMIAVMAFDQQRRGRLISAAELDNYSGLLSTAVMEALLHFIGHGGRQPDGELRYLAVRAAHIIHMLRDTVEDCAAGYYNIPSEYLSANSIRPCDWDHPAYRDWIAFRVALARDYFRKGLAFIRRLESPRCRLAGYAYVARFEWMARLIERDDYHLRAHYPDRKSLRAGLWMAGEVCTAGRGI